MRKFANSQKWRIENSGRESREATTTVTSFFSKLAYCNYIAFKTIWQLLWLHLIVWYYWARFNWSNIALALTVLFHCWKEEIKSAEEDSSYSPTYSPSEYPTKASAWGWLHHNRLTVASLWYQRACQSKVSTSRNPSRIPTHPPSRNQR